ncbi:hypothetical protein ADL21_12565 [Streptomyces albus subsp. albus]|nr:hypothetical protein ADL21_12565 [Streptomyces albus subsp. albus]
MYGPAPDGSACSARSGTTNSWVSSDRRNSTGVAHSRLPGSVIFTLSRASVIARSTGRPRAMPV